MAAPKTEEISHPPTEQLQGLEYCIDSNPSWVETIVLGFQHYILALGTAVMIPSFLVPLMGGSDYLKNFHTTQLPILERFALVISTTVIWAYAHILKASGAYRHRPDLTQHNCRTDRADLISSAPWIKIRYPLEWGAPTFDAGHAFGMMAVVLVSYSLGYFFS